MKPGASPSEELKLEVHMNKTLMPPIIRLVALACCLAFALPARADWLETARSTLNDLVSGKAPKPVPVTQPPTRSDNWGDGEIVPRRGRAVEGTSSVQLVDERMIDDRYGVQERVIVPPTRMRTTQVANGANTVIDPSSGAAPRPRTISDREAEMRAAFERDIPTRPSGRNATERTFGDRAERERTASERTAARERARARERQGSREEYLEGRRDTYRERAAVLDREDAAPVRRSSSSRGMSERQAKAMVDSGASCTNVGRAWEGAANFADMGQTDRAYGAYMRLLSSCRTERELLGTVYQAIRNLPSDQLYTMLDEPIMGSLALQDAAYELKSNLLFRLNRDGKNPEALRMAEEMRDAAMLRKDANVLTVTGYLELSAKRLDKAQDTFRTAIRADRENEKAREGLAMVLLAAGKPDAAWREADRLTGDNASSVKASVRIAQARQAYDNEEPKEALKLLTEAEKLGYEMNESELALKAWSLKGTGQPDKSSRIFAQLNRAAPGNKEYATGLVEAYRSAGEFQKIERLTESVSVVAPIAQAVIADQYIAQGRLEEASAILGTPVEGGSAPAASGTIAVKSKSGTAGAGRLTIVSTPEVAVSAPIRGLGRLVATIGSLRMSDGVNDVTAREGRLGFATSGQTAITAGLTLSTVLGNAMAGGDLTVRRYNAGGFNEIGISRGPVHDSVRSYAGVVDTDGFFYGRVNQVALNFSGNQVINSTWKADYGVSIGSISGRNVSNNGFFRTTLGGIRNMADFGLPWLSAGPQMHVAGYKEDQNLFRGAAGGYFSPKSDVGFGVKALLATEPSDRLVVRGNTYAGFANRSFVDFSESGLQLEGDVSASYLFNENVIASVGTTLRTSPGYNDAAFWISLLVPFEKRSSLNARDIIRPALGIR